MLRITSGPEPVVTQQQQYAVVLLNEDQLDHLMRRPSMRQAGSRMLHSFDLRTRYTRLRRRTAVGVFVLVLAALAVAWLWPPRQAAAAKFTTWTPPEAPTLETAASFSVTAATVQDDARASSTLNRIRGVGLPAFVRHVRDGREQQVLVGPYASLDEAEGVQRRLAALGFPGRVFVDDTLRHSPRSDRRAPVPEGNPNVVLLGAPDRVALVVELPFEPRQVGVRRPGDTALDIDIGPLPMSIRGQQWSAPGGTELIQQVAIEELNEPGNGRYLRARLALPEFARPVVRTEGRRVYIDLSWADDGTGATGRTDAGANIGQAQSARQSPRGVEEARAAIASAVSRFEEVAPFVLRAAESPSPEVLAALDQTLTALDSSLAGMTVPSEVAADHAQLLSAVRSARRAMGATFAGDRLAEAHQAVGAYKVGNAPVTITPAGQ